MDRVKTIVKWMVPVALAALPILSFGFTLFPTDQFPINLPESVALPNGGGLSLAEIKTLIITIANWLMIIGVIIAVLFLALGGIRWVTARGEPKNVEAAKSIIKNGFIGLVVLFGIGVILRTAASLITRSFF